MAKLYVDALPVLFEGGISNYVRPLVNCLRKKNTEKRSVKLLFRLGFHRSRRELYNTWRSDHSFNEDGEIKTYIPDRVVEYLWNRGSMASTIGECKKEDIFLATTELVPSNRTLKVGWVVYDLTPFRAPQFFRIDHRRYLASMIKRASVSDFIVAISENTKRDIVDLLKYPEDRICVVYPGIEGMNISKLPPVLTHNRPYVYYAGSLSLNKNVDGMLRIFSRVIHEHGLDIDIILSGKDFCGKSFWDELTRKLKISDRVRIKGWVSDEERQYLLSQAKMVWQFSWYEGFGLAVLEAAVRGIPVLYANRGAVPEILKNPEQEIDPTDERNAAMKAAEALSSSSKLNRWSELGRERAAEFSWDKSSSKLLKWLERTS
jgi:glycosyltransferase involved in cell wall biosynthesis